MTNEQKVRIDRLERYLISDKMNIYTEVRVNDLDTVLSLIKEQQEKIENLQKELNEENKRCMILANNDKFKEQVIDLMAKCIDVELSSARLGALLNKNVKPLETYKEDIKKYFADLVEKE